MKIDYANPVRFERLAAPATAVLAFVAALALGAGLYLAFFASPTDYQQGAIVRIMYVHVPAATLALAAYAAMAAASFTGFVYKHPLADVAAKSIAPVGAALTFLALATGSIWGKPMWGAWWAWDARLTSMLVLFFLYVGYMAIWRAIDDPLRAARVAAIVCMVGSVNVPIVKFSVDWWYSLHQPASIFRAGGPSIDGAMLAPLATMALFYACWGAAMVLTLMRAELAERRAARIEAAAHPASRLA
jgi:heme exporter protein C